MARWTSSTRARSRRGTSKSGRSPTPKNAFAKQLGKLIALVLVLGLVLLLQRYCGMVPEAFGPGARIVSVDGDSLRGADGADYRLYGIDAPELKQTCFELGGKEWNCGRAAKVAQTKLIKGGDVACEVQGKDRYGRAVAKCSAHGVPDLSEAMVLKGYAIDLGRRTGYAYAGAESEARAENRGIWRGTFQRPSEWRYDHPR